MHETVIINGLVADPIEGLQKLNLAINRGIITKVTPDLLAGEEVIDAEGKYVSPGFIDIHMHTYPFDQSGFIETLNAMARMGVTTVLDGHCGLGSSDFAKSETEFLKEPSPVNYTCLVGHLSLRMMVGCSDLFGPAADDEIAAMILILQEALNAGAPGLSFSLEYVPGTSLKEQLALCEALSAYQGRIVSTHFRYDADRALEAVGEMILVARETGVKYQVSHIGSCAAFGQMRQALQMLEAARLGGVDILADIYPYDSFMTAVGSPVFAPNCIERWQADYGDLYVVDGSHKGSRCSRDIFNEIREQEPSVMVMAEVMNESEIKEAICHPLTMLASDGMLFNGQGHPRGAGAFPRFLGRYVRDLALMDWPAAIDKISAMPARRLDFGDRGQIKEGFAADVTIFDPQTITDCATSEEPAKAPLGIDRVLVGGIETVKAGQLTGHAKGKFLKHE